MNARTDLPCEVLTAMSGVHEVRVLAIHWLAEGVLRFEFGAWDGQPLPGFAPGAHIDVHLPGGLVRSYSLLGDGPQRGRHAIAVQLEAEGRGGSRSLHQGVRVGDRLKVSAPRNLFELDGSAEPVVLIGGGIGITPLLGMAERCQRQGRRWTLHYSVRERARALFEDWRAEHEPHVQLHCTDEAGGFLDLSRIVAQASAGTHFYCCGPQPMLDAFVEATRAWPAPQVHLERFTPLAPAATPTGLQISLPARGLELSVPAGSSILHVLLDAGVDVPYACEQGICGMCEVRVREGQPEHRDAIKPPEEHDRDGTMMVCCSGSRSPRLVLDL